MSSYLITGTSRGLGLTLTTFLLEKPKEQVRFVAAAARTKTPALEALIDKHPGRIAFIPLEVTSEKSVNAAVGKVQEALGASPGLDVLINNAGIMPFVPEGITQATNLMSTFEVNVNSVQLCSAAFLPLLRQGSKKLVLNIDSILGSITLAPSMAPYPTSTYKVSKAAVNMLTVQWALDLAKEDFTIISAHPGWLRTDLGTDQADLPVETGAKGVLQILDKVTTADSGKFFDIHVPDWDKEGKLNKYEGGELPW